MSDDEGTKFETIPLDHPISAMANDFFERHRELAALAGISPMDVCNVFCNTIGMILASSKDMPRDTAFERMDDLRIIMGSAYDLFGVQGTG